MSKQDSLETSDPQILIEDLAVNQDQAAEVRGGPIEIRELTIKVEVPNP